MRARLVRGLRWGLALAAILFVAWVVPVRDRCWDSRSPESTRVAVTHVDGGCVLHLRSGDVREDAAECDRLTCEPGLASTIAHSNGPALAALLGLYALGYLVWSARWRALLDFAGVDMGLMQVWRVTLEAQAGGILLPGGIGGDALRIASVVARPARPGHERAPATIVVASVLLDRAIGLAVLSALASALGFAWGGYRNTALAFVLAAIPVGVAGVLLALRAAPLGRLGWLSGGRLGRVVVPMLQYLKNPRAPRAIFRAVCLSFGSAAIQLAVVRGIIVALGGTPAAERWVYVGSAMSFIVSAVPALPGGWGTADAAWVYFLGLAGLTAGTALGVCLTYRLFWYVSAVVGAIVGIMRARTATAGPAAGPASQPPP
ncbi:MAG: lysylphosphatidylglycerol synthase transmembrane domain-containing protein [Polyangiaceae bacterium]